MSVTLKHMGKITGQPLSMHLLLGNNESRFFWHETKGINKETKTK